MPPKYTFVNASQSRNASSSISVTLSGIVILLSPLQPENVKVLIIVTLSGIVTLSRAVQFINTPELIHVTLSGISMLLSEEQPSKMYSSIPVNPAGSFTFSSDVQLQKALKLIRVTQSGIVKLSIVLHADIAYSPIDVKGRPPNVSGTVTSASEPLYFINLAVSPSSSFTMYSQSPSTSVPLSVAGSLYVILAFVRHSFPVDIAIASHCALVPP